MNDKDTGNEEYPYREAINSLMCLINTSKYSVRRKRFKPLSHILLMHIGALLNIFRYLQITREL